MSLPSLSLTSEVSTGVFTMVFIDFDDTLIPTTIRMMIHEKLGIDVFQLLSSTEMKQLQYSIIRSIKEIRSAIHHTARFCIVSSAQQKWIDNMFGQQFSSKNKQPKHQQNKPKLNVLAKYLNEHKISVVSALEETYKFLSQKFDENTANKMMSSLDENKINKWMWKYTIFSSKISYYKKKLNMSCKRVVSFGDGNDEFKALNHYSSKHNVESLHISFFRAPTIIQLMKQWKYVEINFVKLIIRPNDSKYGSFINKENCKQSLDIDSKQVNKHFFVYHLNDVFKTDNNMKCTGNEQLSGIAAYFDVWMNKLDEYKHDDRVYCVKVLCQNIDQRLSSSVPSSQSTSSFLMILKQSIWKNEEFKIAFRKFYHQKYQKNQNQTKCIV